MKKISYSTGSKARVFGTILMAVFVVCASFTVMFLFPQSPFSMGSVSAATLGDFASYKNITIESDYVGSALTNFPILVHDSSGDLSGIQSDGGDISFWDSTKNTQFNHEIERFDSTSGELWAWVNVSSVSHTVDTTFYMYYDDSDGVYGVGYNPKFVWDSDFVFVLHMNTSTKDSTNNSWTIGNYGATGVDGKVGTAQNFDGSSYIKLTDDAGLESQTYTLEGFAECNVSATTAIVTKIKKDDPWTPYAIYFLVEAGSVFTTMGQVTSGDSDQVHGSIDIRNDKWFSFSFTADDVANEIKMYDNGTLTNTTADAGYGALANDGDVIVGARYTGSYGMYFTGRIDELRYSGIERSDDWINASFHSSNETTGFLTLDSQQSADLCTFTLSGLTDDRVTFAGTAGNSVWCNSTGDGNEWLIENISVNATTNVTDIIVYVGDLNDTSAWINASNITLYVSSDNSSYGSMGSFIDGGSNISVNGSTWPGGGGTNPFTDGAGIIDRSVDIYFVFKLTFPSGSPTDEFYSAAIDTFWIKPGHYV